MEGSGAVTIVGLQITVTVLVPVPPPVSRVSVSFNWTLACCDVCNPAEPEESFVGALLMLTVKFTLHVDSGPPGIFGPRITGAGGISGVKLYSFGFAVAATVKVTPAHAVPASPVAGESIVILLAGSWSPGRQFPGTPELPQDVMKNILVISIECVSLPVVAAFSIVKDQPPTPVCPTVTGVVTVGVSEAPTPASVRPGLNKNMPAMIARATIIPLLKAIFLIFPSFWIISVPSLLGFLCRTLDHPGTAFRIEPLLPTA
jgi:hypothetical protein